LGCVRTSVARRPGTEEECEVSAPTNAIARVVALAVVFAGVCETAAREEGVHHDDDEDGFVLLTRHERIDAGIETESVELRRLRTTVVLPAEVVVNGYLSARVTPKIPSVVEERHVRLGDVVEAGQPLATLSSVAMAEAAGELMLAAYEWRLVRELGRDAVSGRRYAEAETAQRKAMARVLAYGLTERQADALSTSDDLHAFSGRFDLLAPRPGTVFSDDFVVGDLVEPGRVLVEIVDESSVWVEARVTPKIPSVVEERHVRLGDVVEAGQPLATLSSVAMAEAAGELMLAAYEWRLVRELGRDAVSGRRYAEAETAQRKAMARVLAYGLTERQADALSTSDDLHAFSGRFDLLAPRPGTVFSDDFVVGDLVEPGRVLVEIVDESSVWVEARAADLPDAERGDSAIVVSDDGGRFDGRVVQRHHQLDEVTRTRALRIEVENVDDRLHPGQFVAVEFETGVTEPVLAVRRTAVTLMEGSESVFRLEGDEFHPVRIMTGDNVGDWVVVDQGLESGDMVATVGVFHIKSLLLKSSLGSGHAH